MITSTEITLTSNFVQLPREGHIAESIRGTATFKATNHSERRPILVGLTVGGQQLSGTAIPDTEFKLPSSTGAREFVLKASYLRAMAVVLLDLANQEDQLPTLPQVTTLMVGNKLNSGN